MSRSNPTAEIINPSTRWFEFNGDTGIIQYYDKEEKKKIDVPLPFTFIILDSLATVKGWHEASKSGITANEVRDITKDVLMVKSFKGGEIAQGFYREIKDKVGMAGGGYVSSIYIAFKSGDHYFIGNVQFSGASLNSWVEFSKANRAQLMKQAISIVGTTDHQKGKVKYKMPVFALKEVSEAANQIATDLDKELQAYLDLYLKSKKVTEQVAERQEHPAEVSQEVDHMDNGKDGWKPIEEEPIVDDLPF